MQPGFAVKITHDGKPLVGAVVDVVALGRNEKLFSGVSGRSGTVHVTNLPAGDYWLNAEYFHVSAAYECFHVENHPSWMAKKHLTFEWGGYAPATRQITGRFVDSHAGTGGTPLWNMTHRIRTPISSASMTLKNALTGMSYKAISDEKGNFGFPRIPDGTYVLHIEAGKLGGGRDYDAVDFVIDVSTKARGDLVLLTNSEPTGGNCGGISLDLRDAEN